MLLMKKLRCVLLLWFKRTQVLLHIWDLNQAGFVQHYLMVIHAPLGKVKAIIGPCLKPLKLQNMWRLATVFSLIAPLWVNHETLHTCTAVGHDSFTFCSDISKRWLVCHFLPLPHCHSDIYMQDVLFPCPTATWKYICISQCLWERKKKLLLVFWWSDVTASCFCWTKVCK